MLQALLTWSEKAAVSHPETVQELLHACLDLSTDSSPQVRAAFAQDAHAFAQPVLLKAVYVQGVSGSTEQVDIASCEAKLLQVSMLCLAKACAFAQSVFCVLWRDTSTGGCVQDCPVPDSCVQFWADSITPRQPIFTSIMLHQRSPCLILSTTAAALYVSSVAGDKATTGARAAAGGNKGEPAADHCHAGTALQQPQWAAAGTGSAGGPP